MLKEEKLLMIMKNIIKWIKYIKFLYVIYIENKKLNYHTHRKI